MLTAFSHLQRILCIRLDSLGDLLMTAPALEMISKLNQAAKLTLLCSSSGAAAAKLIRGIDEVIIYDAPWMKASPAQGQSSDDRKMLAKLHQAKFDAAIIFTVYSQSSLPAALLCYLAEIPLRAAYARENPYHLLNYWFKEEEPEVILRHEVARHLELVEKLFGALPPIETGLNISAAATARIDKILQRCESWDRSFLLLHTGASAQSRRYPPAKFSRLLEILAELLDLPVILTGSSSEKALLESVKNGVKQPARIFSLAGMLSVEDYAELIRRAGLVISNNTSAVHFASIQQVPVVDIYALTNPQHTPWFTKCRVLYRDVPCKFCYKSVCPQGENRCISSISPDEVARAVLDLWQESQSQAGLDFKRQLQIVS